MAFTRVFVAYKLAVRRCAARIECMHGNHFVVLSAVIFARMVSGFNG
jgi:hypothetical protein